MLTGVAPLQTAEPTEVSFLDNRKYAAALAADARRRGDRAPRYGASACRRPRSPSSPPSPMSPGRRVAALFHPLPPARPGVHPSAVVAPDAMIDPSAEIGPLAVIGARAEIGPRCRIGPAAIIGDGVVLGADCRIGAHASLSHALLGDRVVVYPGARIGQDGFGFAPTGKEFLSVPQLGRVVLEDDVEIGANTHDRSRFVA